MTNQDIKSPMMENADNQRRVWLKIIGIGENGMDGLNTSACHDIATAQHVFGGARHLSLLKGLIKGRAHLWPSPFLQAVDDLAKLRGKNVVVLTSGDPMHFGAGVTFNRYFDRTEMEIYPHPSSFSLAAARLGWPLQDVDCLSVHGRPFDSFIRAIANGKKLLTLANDGKSPLQIAKILCDHGFAKSQIFILEHLEGNEEAIHFFLAKDLINQQFADLNIIGVNCMIDEGHQPFPSFATLPDDAFIHDGQITKQDIRAITLAHLAPTSHELLWDIGAGSGSISIEWLRLGYKCRAIAIEKNANRAQNILKNAENLGVSSQLTLIESNAIDAIELLEAPDAIFIGGGFTATSLFEKCWQKLKKSGRIVVNAVTLESEAMMMGLARQYNGKLIKIEISNAQKLGNFHTWRQALPITMMVLQK